MKFGAQFLLNWYRSVIRNPKYRWWLVIGTLVYLISPIDISPDVIPLLGEIDDVAIVSLMVAEVSQLLMEKYKAKKNQEKVIIGDEESKNTIAEADIKTVDVTQKNV